MKGIKRVRRKDGKVERWFRKPAGGFIRLPDLPESDPGFIAAYSAAVEGRTEKPVIRNKKGSVAYVIESFRRSHVYLAWKASTRRSKEVAHIGKILDAYGVGEFAGLRMKHIVADMRGLPPTVAKVRLETWRMLVREAVQLELIASSEDPTKDVQKPKHKSKHHHVWTPAEVARYRKTHKSGTKARLAFEMLWCIGGRRVDVLSVGWDHVQEDGETIMLVAEKTGVDVWPTITPELRAELAYVPKDQKTWLVSEVNKPFLPNNFTAWFRLRCDEAKCPGSAHGIRHGKHTMLAEEGATAHQIMAAGGWTTLKQAAEYTMLANRRTLNKGFRPRSKDDL